MKKVNKKTQSLIQLALFVGIVVFVNILANARIGGRAFYAYFDMTEEKRFTLTPATRNLLSDLDDVVYVNVLLEGEFPAGFKRLQTAAREMLEDFRSESGYVEYEFNDPGEGTVDQVNAWRVELSKDGIEPVNLRLRGQGSRSERLIYPYAVFYYKGRNIPVNLLENEVPGAPPEVILNNSVSLLEYKFANAIQKLQSAFKPAIVFSSGHGELDPLQTADLEKTLREFYDTGRIYFDSLVAIPPEAAVLIIAKPRAPFSERDKFIIDQYVMNGGKVIWLIDKLRVDLDSIRGRKEYFPNEYELNLDDLLFSYGIRIQPNLVLDMQCSRIPLVTGHVGNAPQFDLFRYPYHPLLIAGSDHPLVKSIGIVNLFYPSTIDTAVMVKTNLKKTVLLASSKNSRVQYVPVGLNFEFLRYELDPEKFKKPHQPLALLLEGIFPSMFENRVTESMIAGLKELGMGFKTESIPTQMLVVSDGDIARNKVNPRNESYGPLGFNEFEKYQFANKDFMINAIEYLLDERGVIAARGKEVKLRMLDTVKAKAESGKWQLINILLPLLFLAGFGFVFNRMRRKRFARQ